jgi:hypothetical protein
METTLVMSKDRNLESARLGIRNWRTKAMDRD